MYRYRCGQCCTTSPSVVSRTRLAEERTRHRDRFHGGHIPDGERVIEPRPFAPSDIPATQWIAGALLILAIVALAMIRHL
ncbi:hypothetical protein OG216_19560 [Streptomycetaceae bacterium NBC_01309]